MGTGASPIKRNDGVSWVPALKPLSQLVLTDAALAAQGRSFALAPPMTALYKYYAGIDPVSNQPIPKRLAVLLNVGPLVEPVAGKLNPSTGNIDLVRFADGIELTGTPKLPARRGSHNDQTLVWSSTTAGTEGVTKGWGGVIADLTATGNAQPVFNGVSVAAQTVFLTGDNTTAYQVTTNNSIAVPLEALRKPLYGSAAASTVLGQIAAGTGVVTTASHRLEQDVTRVLRRSLNSADLLRDVQITQPSNAADDPYLELTALSGNNELAARLRIVAHLIANQQTTLTKRQVFYVTIGGFDTHSGVIQNHPTLIGRVAQAMDAFQTVLDRMGAGNNVTTFTASEFGRTLNANGDGSDHGWGSMHFVLGGAVNGGKLYGKAPVFGDKAQRADGYYDDTTRGSLIPTTSVAQYAATLALWMGVPTTSLNKVVKDIDNFRVKDLGFLKASA
jgi:uncharacterized protein (DUF1501 family)